MKSVLVVDDEFGLAETLCDLLSSEGYHTSKTWNGKAALVCVAEARPDLILLDVMMPILDGRKTIRALKAKPEWSTIPVVMMSAAALLDEATLALCAGFLRKPFDYDELLAVVRKHIGPGA